MSQTIALIGNPNCGKTTLFNYITGANQYVGNWPGVTLDKACGYVASHDFKVVDLGVNVSAESFADAAMENKADIVCLSSLLTTTMDYMRVVINEFKSRNMSTKIMVGGAPVTQEYADEIGASGYSADATSAVELAKRLVA